MRLSAFGCTCLKWPAPRPWHCRYEFVLIVHGLSLGTNPRTQTDRSRRSKQWGDSKHRRLARLARHGFGEHWVERAIGRYVQKADLLRSGKVVGFLQYA